MMKAKLKGRSSTQCQWKRPTCLWNISYYIQLTIFVCCFFANADFAIALRGNLLLPQAYSPINGDLNVQLQYFSQEKRKTLNNLNSDESASSSSEEFDILKTTSAPAHFKPRNDDIRLQISYFSGTNRTTVAILDVYPDPRSNTTQVTISCLNFLFGGTYELEIVGGNDVDEDANTLDTRDERLRQQLDVRWPQPKLSVTPESIGTYPQQPVDVILEFPGIECIVPHTQIDRVPEFWLELYFCGHEVYCDSTNVSSSQVLYAERIRGYPKARLIKLSCELFGLAGHYVVKLRPIAPVAASVSATAYIQADWSEQFVFNVHARSISPCDPHTGIGVLFEYPACILDRADRIRLFGKLRADVASLAPPTSMHYITEQRVVRGQHALHFDCDFFSEKYVEYCFVYVSQAISGAVADVRMDCLPTLPVRDSERGGWGAWSEWTPCSSTCSGGTRNRYRVCDSPPPRYGAMFCEGSAVETEECGGSITDSWDCIYGATGSFLPPDFAERPGIKADLGSDCRCGCIVHLTVSKPRRIVTASAQSCPGRTFWLIQADPGYRIRFHFDFFRLICADQYVRVRDGDSLLSELVGEFVGGTSKITTPILSSNSKLLLEFYSNELSTIGESCKGGFLTHAQQFQSLPTNVTAPRMSKAIMSKISTPTTSRITMVHIIAILFSSIIIVVSALLGIQYLCRYRKYQLAESAGEPDSPAHTPRTSMGSIATGQLPSRAVSTSTLLSEVVSFVKIRPRGRGRWMKHSRLRESVDAEALEIALHNGKSHSDAASLESTHTLTNETFNESNDACEMSDVITAPKRKKNNKQQQQQQETELNGECSNEALSEQLTTSPSTYSSTSPGSGGDIEAKDDGNVDVDDDGGGGKNTGKFLARYKRRNSNNGNSISLPRTPLDTPIPRRREFTKKLIRAGTTTNTNTATTSFTRRNNNSTLTDKDTFVQVKNAKTTVKTNCNGNNNKDSGSDDVAHETKSVNGNNGGCMSTRKKRAQYLNMVGSRSSNKMFEHDSERDSDSLASINKQRAAASSSNKSDAMRRLSVSNSTLRNGCHSPASSGSVISMSTNRSVNIKESKEKKNREKLLAGPGSEFSLAPEDMEMDYYDYNVINAGAAPGSYLGMDPAYLVWIPPLDGEDAEHSDDANGSDATTHSDDDEPHYDEISPIYDSDTPANRLYRHHEQQPPELPPLPPMKSKSMSSDSNEYIDEKCKNADLNKILIANAFTCTVDDGDGCDDNVDSPKGIRQKLGKHILTRKVPVLDTIPMTELRSKKSSNTCVESTAKVQNRTQSYQSQQEQQRCSYASNDDKDIGTEKETAVVKSPSDNFKNYYELDDIQFADDDSDDDDGSDAFNRAQHDYATPNTQNSNNSHTPFKMH